MRGRAKLTKLFEQARRPSQPDIVSTGLLGSHSWCAQNSQAKILRHAAHIRHRDGPQEHQPQRHCGLMRYFRAESRSGLDSTQEVFEKLPGESLENLASPTGFEPVHSTSHNVKHL